MTTMTIPAATEPAPSKPRKPHIHVSDVLNFTQCRIRWDYSATTRRNLQSRKTNKHLWLGSAAHYALAAYYGSSKGTNPFNRQGLLASYEAWVTRSYETIKEAEFGQVPEAITEYAELGRQVLRHYGIWAQTHDDFEVLATEVKLLVDMGDYMYSGTADGIVRTPDGQLWILENKTYTFMKSFATMALSPQAAIYTFAARNDPAVAKLGQVAGVMYNILGKSVPKAPERLQSGELSRNKAVRCTPELYRAVLRHYKLAEGPYEAFMASIDGSRFFRRYPVTFSEDRMRIAVKSYHMLAKEMLSNPILYPADPVRSCDLCDFRPLCELRLYGADWQALADADYMVRPSEDIAFAADGED